MQPSKRQFASTSVLALFIYLVPNLVQDVHRIWGHQANQQIFSSNTGIQLHSHYDKCDVCVFEFNVVEEASASVYVPVLQTVISLFVENREQQFQNKAFHYYNLRAPPQA